MFKNWLKIIAVSVALLGGIDTTHAETVDQGATGNRGSWKVKQVANGVVAQAEVLVTNAAGGSAMPTTALPNRWAIEIKNHAAANAIWCKLGTAASPPTPTTSTASGSRKVAAGETWSLDIGPNIVMKCISEGGAAQSSGSGTTVVEIGGI